MHIFITGFMGIGKTTIGKQLAEILQLPFIDLDNEIEVQEQQTIQSIFSTKGEEYFRLVEKKCLENIITSNRSKTVIALGGGTMCHLNNHTLLLKSGLIIYLKKDWAEIEAGLHLLSERPKLQHADSYLIKQLYLQREPIYALSQLQTLANTSFTVQKLSNWLKLLTNR